MAQDAARAQRKTVKRSWAIIRGLAAFCIAGLLFFGSYQALMHPDTPLPRAWNPTRALAIADPVTPFTNWKLNRATASFDQCLSVLEGAAQLEALTPRSDSAQCFINDRVNLRRVGGAQVNTLETRCAIALRMAMWERHSLQPAAQTFLGTSVNRIAHIGSYNCRALRTANGPSTRMSTHATADAIDIAGFDLRDGRRIRLLADWAGTAPEAAFLRAVRDGACDWFRLTLSPDYNRLHADHFHLQSTGWGLCR